MTESVLVASPYPTMGGAESAASFEMVKGLVADGHHVVVVSPRPSAAHYHADPGSPRGAARLAQLVAGHDRFLLRLDAGALAAGADAPRLLPARLALSVAVRRAARADVILDRVPPTVSARWASMVLGRAASVTVASDAERESLAAAGVARDRVVVDANIIPPSPDRLLDVMARGPGSTRTPASSSAEAIEELVRRRATESLTPAEAGFGPGQPSPASRPLRSLPPLERPRIRSNNPAYAAVKRAQLKLLAWMFDWVIQHVNQLHQATIEAIDLADEERRDR